MAQPHSIGRPTTFTASAPVTHEGDVSTEANFFSLYRRTEVTATPYAASATADELLGVTATATTAVTINLPAVNSVPNPGRQKAYTIVDEGGNAGTNPITVAADTADSVLGQASVTIDVDYGSMRFYSVAINGTHGRWFCGAAVPS